MRRGTEVGRGYVALEINGDGMNEQIVRDVDKAGDGVDKVGEKHGEDYGEGFEKGSDGYFDRLTEHIEKNLDRDFKNMGRRLGRSLGNSISKQLGSVLDDKFDEIEQSMARLVDTVEHKVSGNGGRSGGGGGPKAPPAGGYGDGTPDDPNRSFYSAFEKARVALHRAANKMIADSDKALLVKQEAQMKILVKAEEARQKAVASMEQENSKIVQRFVEKRVELQRKSNEDIIKDDDRKNHELLRAQEKLFAALEREGKKRGVNRAGKKTRDDLSIGDSILAYRSRNNAVFLLSQTLGRTVKLAEDAGKAGLKMFKVFGEGFSEAEEGASVVEKTLAGISKTGSEAGTAIGEGFSALLASGPGVVAAIIAIAVAASALVSVLTALLGIIVGLVATIYSALVGALAVAGAGFFTLIAAAGLLVVAFKSMSAAQKALFKTSFTPFLQDLKGIGRLIINEVAPSFKTWGDNMKTAIDLLAPFASTFGKAFAGAGDIITKALSGPGFQQFITTLGVYLPAILTGLSTAFGGFLNGALSLFSAIIPYVAQFAAYLGQVATRFANFASGADGGNGPNRISAFVERAVVSLQSLWNFLVAVGGVINRVLFSAPAQGFGNGLFDGLTRSLNTLRSKINDGALERWFTDAGKFAHQMAVFVQGLFRVLQALYSSGVLEAVGLSLKYMASTMIATSKVIRALFGPLQTAGALAHWLSNILYSFSHSKFSTSQFGGPLGQLVGWLGKVAGAAAKAFSLLSRLVHAKKAAANTTTNLFGSGGFIDTLSGIGQNIGAQVGAGGVSIPDVGSFGGGGGGGGGGGKGGGSKGLSAKEIRKQMRDINAQIAAGLRDARRSSDPKAVRDNLAALVKSIKAADDQLGKANRRRVSRVAERINAQRVIKSADVDKLVNGLKVQNATLADYAAARQKVAAKLAEANTALTNAIALRDNYKTSVTDAVNSYGALTTATAQTLNGIQQALTTTDITSNLQTRLDKIKKFQSDLQILTSQGLSNAAYKQIVDAGVESGSQFTDALIAGGAGSVQAVNGLVSQINSISDSLGLEASNRLYQAGVDAAQGLVDGLTSLSAKLDSAATKLGEAIARSLKKALGIHSPSRVMYEAMGYVGDGIEDGLDDQHVKVGRASDRLADQIRVSPSAAEYANAQAAPKVSGNSSDPRFRDLIVHTPTEDPEAVALEVVNEITGRL